MERGKAVVVHRHLVSSETVVCLRGCFEEGLYDEDGGVVESVDRRVGDVLVQQAEGVKRETAYA